MSKTYYFILILLMGIICIAFYLLMAFTPLYADDFNYNLIFGTHHQIVSITDILTSQYNHYFLMNGRFVPHFFVQLFDGILGKELFNIANTVVFLVFLMLLSRFPNRNCLRRLTIVLALTLLLFPGFNNAFLWLSGACNYLWVAVLLLLYSQLMAREYISPYYYLLLFLFGVVCGWTNEALVVGFVAGTIVYYAFHRKKILLHRIFLFVGLIAGTLLLVLSPGSIHRFFMGKEGTTSFSDITHQLLSSLLAMDNLRLLPLLLVLLLIAMVFKKISKNFFSDNLLWIVAIVVSFAFVLLTGHQADHSRFGIELFSLILILKMLDAITIQKILVVLCCLAIIVVFIPTIYYSYLNYQEYKLCVTQIQNNKSGIIETNEVKWPSFFDRLILQFKPSENNDFYFIQNFWIDRYFEKNHLLFLPHRFLDRVRNDKFAFVDFEVNTDLPFYAKRIKSDSVSEAVFHLSEPNKADVPFYIRPFADKMERYSAREVKTNNMSIINIPQGRFVLVMKNHMVANRVDSITVQ